MTLTELVTTSAILLVATGLIWQTIQSHTHKVQGESAQIETQNDLRIWMARIVGDLRRACFNPREVDPSPFTILAHTENDFHFYTDWDSDGSVDADGRERLGYRLNTTTNDVELWLGGSTWRPVVQNVTGFTFTYWNAKQEELDPDTLLASDIHEIRVTLSARPSRGIAPGATAPTLSEVGIVELRNAVS
jgi:hypothetical protein